MEKINIIDLLDKVKSAFEILSSECRYEEFSDGCKMFNETIAFSVPTDYRGDVKELCSLVELIYILKSLGYDIGFINLYSKVLVRKEGENTVHFSLNFIDAIINDSFFSLTEKGIIDWIKEIERESDYTDNKLILLNRVDWDYEENSICFRKRLAIGAVGKKSKQLKLVPK